ncbi:ABC transporter ATP-binding protein [Pseudonocardia sp. RS010]|uniref:ABC transporter ATP-binding protein n=1 Tax=Pseudonocardia sp. RS010 TaxID=3385979 RepID=UPI00399FF02B
MSVQDVSAQPHPGVEEVGPQTALGITDVTYRYAPGSPDVLRGLSLQVSRGTTMGVVGPSGCGKSTLLSLVAGLREVDGGRVEVHSFDPGRQTVAMMFQKDTLLPWKTVEQNIRLYYRFKKPRDRKAVDELVAELIDLAHLNGYEKMYPYQLSGGQRRRVALLSAVAAQPELLLLDEPFSALDEPTRLAIHQDVLRIMKRMEMSAILVTHDLAEAISLSDEVSILTAGPGRVAGCHSVPFGRDRDVLALRKTPEFLSMYGVLWDELSAQIRASAASPGTPATDEEG